MVTTDDLVMHDWILDSGASFHVTPHKEWFTTYDASRKSRVCLSNDYACEIIGVGDVQLKFQHGSTFTLKNVRHVPKLTKSLISAGDWMMLVSPVYLVIALGKSTKFLLL